MTPFEVMETDIDRFIMLCNYLTGLGGEKPQGKTHDDREEAADFWAAL